MENTHERRWFGKFDIIPWPCLFGLHSKRMSNKQWYCGQLQKHVRIQDLSCSGKLDANSSSWSYNMGSHAKKWVERCSELGNKNNSTIIQSRNSMYWRPPIQGRKSGICWRFVENMFWNACIWLVMVDLIIYGPWTNLLVLSQNGPELVTNAQHV